MAYTLPIPKEVCRVCGKRAALYVFNRFNANNGAYCTRHADAYVKELKARDA